MRATAVLISGRGSNLAALLQGAEQGAPYAVRVVISNNPEAPGLARAIEAGVEALAIDHRPFGEDRAAFERVVDGALRARGIELVALAGFMRVLSPVLAQAWAGRMVNIHPSLLPLFPGLDTHRRALAAGVRVHGASVHYVTDGVDQGPIIGQAAVPVFPDDSPETLAARVLEAERVLYPNCLALAAQGRGGEVRGFAPPRDRAVLLNGFLPDAPSD